MPYIGNQSGTGFSKIPAKQDLTGATGTSLTLTHAVASAEGIDLFINNVRQEPTEAYSVGSDGVTVTLTGSVVATDDIYVVYNSLAQQTSTHPSNQALQATSGSFSSTLAVTGTSAFTGASTFTGVSTFTNGLKLGSGTDTLSVYDEGTFNPVMGASSGSITTQSGTGEYVRIGNLCFIYMVLTVTNKGTASGTVTVSGLPFASGTLRSPMISRENAQTGVVEQFVVDQENTTGFLKATGGGNVTLQSGNVRLIAGCYIVG